MPDDTETRAVVGRHDREIGVLDAGYRELKEDVNEIGEESRKTRHDMRNSITASELRVTQHVDERVGDLERRIERMISTGRWIIGLSVPVVCVLIGLLIGQQ